MSKKEKSSQQQELNQRELYEFKKDGRSHTRDAARKRGENVDDPLLVMLRKKHGIEGRPDIAPESAHEYRRQP